MTTLIEALRLAAKPGSFSVAGARYVTALEGQVAHLEGQMRSMRDGSVCSNCGESYEGDPEHSASDCCLCDLVPAHELPALLKQARDEIESLETKISKVEDALA